MGIMTKERFPSWLARQLDRKEWSQSELARRIETSSSVVNRWVRGERVPDTKSIDRLADVFNADVDRLLTMTGHRPDFEDDADDPIRADLLDKLQRVRLDRERIHSLEYFLNLFLEEDASSANDVKEVVRPRDKPRVGSPN